MSKCKLLNKEMDLNNLCPVSINYKWKFLCYKDCGFSPLRDKYKKRIIQSKLEKFI